MGGCESCCEEPETVSVQTGFHQDEQPSAEFTTVSAPTHYDNPAAVGIGSAVHMDGGGGDGIIGIGGGAHFDSTEEQPVGIQSATH